MTAGAVQDVGLWPVPARGGQLLGRLVVAGNQDRRLARRLEDVQAHGEVAPDVGEVAGADQYVGLVGTLDEATRGGSIGVQVAEQEQLQGPGPPHVLGQCPLRISSK